MFDKADWERTAAFHGHVCPGVAVGFRASLYALRQLELYGKSLAATHYAIMENNLCGVDAVQLITGCTLGNDSLIIENQGKQAFSFVNKQSGQGVRVVLTAPLWLSEYPLILHQQVKLGTASAENKQEFFRLRQQRGEELLALSDEELFKVEQIVRKIPGKPRLFPIVTCSNCGEGVMVNWSHNINHRVLCSTCAERFI